ncbi:cytochrome c oxidase assembly protein [Ornithinimicrobium cryptoxanthini]|uniref:cytochrome c oxidase assembly protein n=1 Tax=Ornithinimicrobium cryptoxanthini TaxID=2934161 RepID=UPI0021176FBE|nr:cytochrome c oxidase assembly protein [Ornithinimicrobium cryptoxanthini]
MVHHQPGVATGWFEVVALAALLVASVGYGTAAWRARRRGRWPAHRSLLWAAGALCAGGAIALPVVASGQGSFTTHMVTHLLLGMLAPLLLVLSAPVTLALRALPQGRARVLSAVLRSQVARVLMHPAVAAVLNVGGLWVLYSTDLFHRMHNSDLVYAVVHVHLLVVGYVFTASIIGPDPDPHRASMRVRSLVLVLFIAAHSVLAKWLYAHPPDGVEAGDARVGAQVMYYGGDAVDVVIIVLLFAGHARATRRRRRSSHVRGRAARPSGKLHA